MSWKELCFLFQVPYAYFDPNMPWSDQEHSTRNWITNTIVPACKQFDGELNRVLLKAFGLDGSVFIGSDFSELPELQDDMLSMAQAFQYMWWISPNDKAEAQGFERNPDPRFDEPWIPQGFTPLSEVSNAAEMDQITQQLQQRGLLDNANGSGKVGI